MAVCMLHRYDDAAGAWVPVPVAVQTTLAREVEGGGLYGAGFRVSHDPAWSEWFAQVAGTELSIQRRAYYEAAMWVPLLEKVFARFGEMFGQYGGHPGFRDEEKSGGSGYDIIEGGWSSPYFR